MRDKHQIIEEPDEEKFSRPVLKTSEAGDSLTEFNYFLSTSDGEQVKKDLSARIHHCHACGSIKPRDVAAAQVISARGQRVAENACGVEATGAEDTQSSWLALKQEIFGATQRTQVHTA
jgi:hypothetical protein